DNLSGIASSHGMSLSELRKLNPKLTEFIYPGQKLSVARYAEEVKEPPVKPAAVAAKGSTATKFYTVQAGDNLSIIAERNSITLASLRRLNPGVDAKILPGQKLLVSDEPSQVTSPGRTYIVQKGDNLSVIANKLGTSLSDLRQANPEAESVIRPGQRLVVP
ncbi:MAG: LysM peptidoglycan-binding domain-containing protein, partial [Bdellovibrionales bacterium]|nr:LysM peptidoglycan-binding domain-containing protein [Bdellovibrionales bacterium]